MNTHTPQYEIKPEPNSPIYWVLKDGVKERDFTSLVGAQAWIDHASKVQPNRRKENPLK